MFILFAFDSKADVIIHESDRKEEQNQSDSSYSDAIYNIYVCVYICIYAYMCIYTYTKLNCIVILWLKYLQKAVMYVYYSGSSCFWKRSNVKEWLCAFFFSSFEI